MAFRRPVAIDTIAKSLVESYRQTERITNIENGNSLPENGLSISPKNCGLSFSQGIWGEPACAG